MFTFWMDSRDELCVGEAGARGLETRGTRLRVVCGVAQVM